MQGKEVYGSGAERLGALFVRPVRVREVLLTGEAEKGRCRRAPAGEARATPEVVAEDVAKPVSEHRRRCDGRLGALGARWGRSRYRRRP